MQERFKSDNEIRYQIIVSVVKIWKKFGKVYDTDNLFKKFQSEQFIVSFKSSHIMYWFDAWILPYTSTRRLVGQLAGLKDNLMDGLMDGRTGGWVFSVFHI